MTAEHVQNEINTNMAIEPTMGLIARIGSWRIIRRAGDLGQSLWKTGLEGSEQHMQRSHGDRGRYQEHFNKARHLAKTPRANQETATAEEICSEFVRNVTFRSHLAWFVGETQLISHGPESLTHAGHG
eukprot:766628-Rhodomonas_salina.2